MLNCRAITTFIEATAMWVEGEVINAGKQQRFLP